MPGNMLRRNKPYDPKYSGKPNQMTTVGKRYFSEIKQKIPSLSGLLIIILVGYIILDRIGRSWNTGNVRFNNKGKLMDGNYSGVNPKLKGVNDVKNQHDHKFDDLHFDDPQEKEFIRVIKHNANLKGDEKPIIPIFDANVHLKEKHEKLDKQNPDWQKNIIHPEPKKFPVPLLKVPKFECETPLTLLLLVHTNSHNFGDRRGIRETWGIQEYSLYERFGKTVRWKTIFVLGKSTDESEKIVSEEAEKFGDMLQGDFIDNRYEDTRKFMMALKWVTENLGTCMPRFILKSRDNTFHNMFSIMDWLDAKFSSTDHNIYMGKILRKDRPVRDEQDPYYVPTADYGKPFYPNMINGPLYLFDVNAYKTLATRMSRVTPVAQEDGYIGLLAEQSNLVPVHNDHFQLLHQSNNICHNLRIFFIYKIKAYEHIKIFHNNKNIRASGKCGHAQVYEKNKLVDIVM